MIFCGHFPDGTETFDEECLDGETKGEWYVRQMLGSANLSGSPLFHIMTGNLSHQIEHHLFPDVPSNRYARIAPRVREICERYGLPYTTGPLPKQYGKVLRTILRLSLPGGGAPSAPGESPRRVRTRRSTHDPEVAGRASSRAGAERSAMVSSSRAPGSSSAPSNVSRNPASR